MKEEKDAAPAAEDRAVVLHEEIAAEVNLLALQGESLSFQERVVALSSAIQSALSSSNINFNPQSNTTIDACDQELAKVSRIVSSVKRLLLALRIHEGFLWLRQQEIAQDSFAKGVTLHLSVGGEIEAVSDIVKFKLYQQKKYFSNRDNISRAISLCKICKIFPEIINSEKSWSWFRTAMSNDKLLDAVKAHQGK